MTVRLCTTKGRPGGNAPTYGQYGPLLVEEYIEDGVDGHAGGQPAIQRFYGFQTDRVYLSCRVPVQNLCTEKTSELHPEANIPCNDPALELQLKTRPFKYWGFGGVGYARRFP